MHQCQYVVTLACLFALPLAAQQPAPDADDLPRIFLDCHVGGCDSDYLRTELAWLNFVRDRTLAQVHIIATSQGTASGGNEVTVSFLGIGAMAHRADTLVGFSEQGATFDMRRELVRRLIAQGMLRYVTSPALAERLTIQYRAPTVVQVASDTRGAYDRWNLWVFRINTNTRFNGEESRRSAAFNGSLRASRTTAAFKTLFAVNGNYNENHYTLSDGEKFATYRNGWNAEALLVKSVNEHWSVGVQGNAASSVTSNLDHGIRVGPAIEYDLYPYSQSTRRQVVMRYSVGVKSLAYDSLTIYDQLGETLTDHRLAIAAEVTQPWGNIGGNATFSQYLNDPSKYRMNVGAGVSWRLSRGLNLNFDLGYSKIRDQLNLKRGNATDEDVFLALRQLATGYEYWGNVGVSYTFGSIFQNVVNPRFTRNTGGWFF